MSLAIPMACSMALKARFGTARNVMKKLGLDDALLDFDERQSEGERAKGELSDEQTISRVALQTDATATLPEF